MNKISIGWEILLESDHELQAVTDHLSTILKDTLKTYRQA